MGEEKVPRRPKVIWLCPMIDGMKACWSTRDEAVETMCDRTVAHGTYCDDCPTEGPVSYRLVKN